jgi:hypothetical protein
MDCLAIQMLNVVLEPAQIKFVFSVILQMDIFAQDKNVVMIATVQLTFVNTVIVKVAYHLHGGYTY